MFFTIFLSFRISVALSSPSHSFFLRVLVNTAPVILSTILLPCSIFDAGDCEQFYKIYICEFYFFQNQTQLLEVFSL